MTSRFGFGRAQCGQQCRAFVPLCVGPLGCWALWCGGRLLAGALWGAQELGRSEPPCAWVGAPTMTAPGAPPQEAPLASLGIGCQPTQAHLCGEEEHVTKNVVAS